HRGDHDLTAAGADYPRHHVAWSREMNDDSGALPGETSLADEPGAALEPAQERSPGSAPWLGYGLPEPIGGGGQRTSILFVAWRDLANRQAGGSEGRVAPRSVRGAAA